MRKIHVDAGNPYTVVIGSGILDGCGKAVLELNKAYDKIAVISDDDVHSIYGERVRESFEAAGFPVAEFVFPHGEASKSMSTLDEACGFLCDNFITRKSLVAALGGGVCGDLAGFLAAIYQRGIDYIQIPTTFLAMIDSSVGGKTAVNIPQGKNMLGAFWQPALVWCDIDSLDTLDRDFFKDGVAEAVKYGCILEKDLFELMERDGFSQSLPDIIARCVELKADVVRQDERDNGLRMILNFGHTLGHGVEKLSGFKISHGKAVAIGMVLAARAGEMSGLTLAGTAERIEKILDANGISTTCPYPLSDVISASLGDKKREGENLSIILLNELGKSFIRPVPIAELDAFFSGRS